MEILNKENILNLNKVKEFPNFLEIANKKLEEIKKDRNYKDIILSYLDCYTFIDNGIKVYRLTIHYHWKENNDWVKHSNQLNTQLTSIFIKN